MDVLDLRLIEPRDLRPLLEEEQVAWREMLRWDYAATAAMVLRFVEARALTGYALLDGRRMAGYSFYVVENGKGLIGDAFVSAAFRDGANEVQLLTHIVESLQATPGVRRIEAQLLSLDAPGLRRHFQENGFQCYERQFLYLPLPEAAGVGPEGAAARLAPWQPANFPATAELILAAYQGHVDSRVSDQYRSREGVTRFLENIIRYPGCGEFLPEASFLALSEEIGGLCRPCGVILCSRVSEGVAHITQLCVAPGHQRRGVGRQLLGAATGALREKGYHGATLSVTLANAPAVELYRRLGFQPLTTFPAFVWDAAPRRERFSPKKMAARP